MAVEVVLGGSSIPIDTEVFELLFTNSVVAGYVGVTDTLEGKPLPFRDFLKLSRQAEIPYPLFFAPTEVVEAQLRLKNEKLMAGFTKSSFSMHSRQSVALSDVELIVKDLLRKQELLRKYDAGLTKNPVVGMLKNSGRSVRDDADLLLKTIGLRRQAIRGAKTKEAALEVIIERLEANQVLVARSAKDYMPQIIPRHARFSGLTIKDKKVPFIFLATGDEGEHLEPAGRKLFTLVLLTVLIARGVFAPVNYDGHTREEGSPREYRLTAEILMPEEEFRSLPFATLQDVKDAADFFRVTPSAVAMRARHLGQVSKETFGAYMDALQLEYEAREKPHARSALPVNALRKYNGAECSRRMLAVLDAGQISSSDFRRIMFLNKASAALIPAFREAVS